MKETILEKLNNSNFLVGVAGPGAGKTYTFKEIINSDEYKNKKILILSFINKLVSDLSKDFEKYSNVEVKTLHAFASKYLGETEIVENLDKIISEDYLIIRDKVFNFEEAFANNKLLGPNFNDEFSFYKERKKFYEKDKKIYSFNSSIFAINMHFEKEEKIPRYDLILVDEFQDFNKLEYSLISKLNSNSKVVIVGDDDQSLYGFKHADPSIIRSLYMEDGIEKFSLDYCRRCTKVIVEATNSLIKNSKSKGFLANRIDKKFLYPENENSAKDLLSSKNNKIDFLSRIQGGKLIYELDKKIRLDLSSVLEKKRILILAPKFYHPTVYNGLIKFGYNVIDYEIFSNEKSSKHTHQQLINSFSVLEKNKTNNLHLRNLIDLYLKDEDVKVVLNSDKDIWKNLSLEVKEKIEFDIELFKKIKSAKNTLNDREVVRMNQIFNIKNVIAKMIYGFDKVRTESIEVEIVTAMSSKGLSADLVYFLHVDDEYIFGKDKEISNNKLCEFLVGITRTKEKLTLFSLKDDNPVIIDLLGSEKINRIRT